MYRVHKPTDYSLPPEGNTWKGVYLDRHENLWKAQIYINGKVKHLGRFYCIKLAAIAYNNAVKNYHLNRPLNKI